MNKKDLPSLANLNLNVQIARLREETDKLAEKFTDVKTRLFINTG